MSPEQIHQLNLACLAAHTLKSLGVNSTEDREAWLDAAERDLRVMRAYLAQLEQRWARIQSDFGVLASVAENSMKQASHA